MIVGLEASACASHDARIYEDVVIAAGRLFVELDYRRAILMSPGRGNVWMTDLGMFHLEKYVLPTDADHPAVPPNLHNAAGGNELHSGCSSLACARVKESRNRPSSQATRRILQVSIERCEFARVHDEGAPEWFIREQSNPVGANPPAKHRQPTSTWTHCPERLKPSYFYHQFTLAGDTDHLRSSNMPVGPDAERFVNKTIVPPYCTSRKRSD